MSLVCAVQDYFCCFQVASKSRKSCLSCRWVEWLCANVVSFGSKVGAYIPPMSSPLRFRSLVNPQVRFLEVVDKKPQYDFHQKNFEKTQTNFFFSLWWKQDTSWKQVTCSYLPFPVLVCHDFTFCWHKVNFFVILWKKKFQIPLWPTNISVFWRCVFCDCFFFKPSDMPQTLDHLCSFLSFMKECSMMIVSLLNSGKLVNSWFGFSTPFFIDYLSHLTFFCVSLIFHTAKAFNLSMLPLQRYQHLSDRLWDFRWNTLSTFW